VSFSFEVFARSFFPENWISAIAFYHGALPASEHFRAVGWLQSHLTIGGAYAVSAAGPTPKGNDSIRVVTWKFYF
jgi:hypothetical protein